MIPQSMLRPALKPGERLVCYCPPDMCQAPRGFRGPCNRASDVAEAAEAEYQSWLPVMLEYERCRIALKKVVDDYMADRASRAVAFRMRGRSAEAKWMLTEDAGLAADMLNRGWEVQPLVPGGWDAASGVVVDRHQTFPRHPPMGESKP